MQVFSNQKYKLKKEQLEFLQDRVISRKNEREENLYNEEGTIVETNFIYDETIYTNVEYVEKCRVEILQAKADIENAIGK